MKVKIFIDGNTADQDLSSLYQWLSRNPELRQGVKITAEDASAESGEMGIDLESINAIVSNVLAMGSLVTSIATWKDSRLKSPTVHIESGAVTVIVDSGSPEAVRSIVEKLNNSTPESTGTGL